LVLEGLARHLGEGGGRELGYIKMAILGISKKEEKREKKRKNREQFFLIFRKAKN